MRCGERRLQDSIKWLGKVHPGDCIELGKRGKEAMRKASKFYVKKIGIFYVRSIPHHNDCISLYICRENRQAELRFTPSIARKIAAKLNLLATMAEREKGIRK